jgi:hypothetical protein
MIMPDARRLLKGGQEVERLDQHQASTLNTAMNGSSADAIAVPQTVLTYAVMRLRYSVCDLIGIEGPERGKRRCLFFSVIWNASDHARFCEYIQMTSRQRRNNRKSIPIVRPGKILTTVEFADTGLNAS